MPATEVSPSLRRRLSDDARQLLRAAFASPTEEAATVDLRSVPLAHRLQHFRGCIRLELPEVANAVRLRIVVSDVTYLVRYHVESIGAEVVVFSKEGALTTWISTTNGLNIQLREYMTLPSSPLEVRREIAVLFDLLEAVDLFDIFRACLTARLMESTIESQHKVYMSTTDKCSYAFVVDRMTGKPLAITQTATSSSTSTGKLQLVVEDYLRFTGDISVPNGIKSDVEIMIGTAMHCFQQWSPHGQKRLVEVFEAIDRDDDGVISAKDVYTQLLAGGHTERQCSTIVLEMTRLLCDTADPTEEFGFYSFAGFWITMLADSFRVSDPANEATVLLAFERLFLGLKD